MKRLIHNNLSKLINKKRFLNFNQKLLFIRKFSLKKNYKNNIK